MKNFNLANFRGSTEYLYLTNTLSFECIVGIRKVNSIPLIIIRFFNEIDSNALVLIRQLKTMFYKYSPEKVKEIATKLLEDKENLTITFV
jgi:hypothetical protein